MRQIVSESSDIVVAAEVDCAEDLLKELSENHYDVILLDISMPGMDGIEALRRIKQANPEARVLILSMHSEEQFALRALKAGAAGYLTKTSAPNDLVKAVRRVSLGKTFISPRLTEQLTATSLLGSPKLPHERLSAREFQVLCLLGKGKSIGEIADDLNLSVKTISTFRARICAKMFMDKTTELIAYALQNNLC
jgi:DNA-binding NarL/FixJ family response regulator